MRHRELFFFAGLALPRKPGFGPVSLGRGPAGLPTPSPNLEKDGYANALNESLGIESVEEKAASLFP